MTPPLPDRTWPRAEVIEAARVGLEPLRVEHAAEVAAALDDPVLHEFIGGRPASAEELRSRFAALVSGRSPDGSQGWLNWVVRDRASRAVVGTVAATLSRSGGEVLAEVAWVVAARWQGHGLAKEAAAAMASWLRNGRADRLAAWVHPQHAASAGVAEHIGLRPTEELFEGERRWVSDDVVDRPLR